MSKIQGIIVKVIGNEMVAINKGSRDGIKPGMRFLVYLIGEELKDPKTHENLGRIKLPKGRGYVHHVQEKISILKAYRERSIHEISILSLKQVFEKTPPTGSFDNPEVGDRVEEI